ncbi:serine/threonine-protein kinase [Garicola koreensis]|uniref:non-specific serine/threonine protein kinase n=1 Tax=Garicola koreensis TaxID=1262554 RepID=A0A7W5XKF4_9MICC|nr:serine/threonine-protein kinase [Garicola koreensis]MBB3667517.1 tRNA A-37 threonylcarbamoyl transferase component Bud32 [Garicola koreensis]
MTQGLDRYQMGDVIGVGSFATVHRAHDALLDDTVVLKVLAENHSLNPEIRERFISEGRSLRKVQGSHVVAVHDIGETARQQPHLVLEHADRGTVQSRVAALWRQGWRAGRQDALAFARPLAAAVDAVHRQQLVHRDLSPGNLLLATKPSELIEDESAGLSTEVLRADERLLIADLGMCKDLAMNSGLTVSGGTAGFRPPEQAGPGMVDTRADIWAMSALLQWLTKEAELPKAFHKVLTRGMATAPNRRQPDVAAWLAELEEALAPPVPEPEPIPETEPPRTQGQPAGDAHRHGLPGGRRRRRWRTVGVAGLIILVTALAGLLTGYLLRGPDDPVAAAEGASVSVEGPSEVQVGEPATFTADVEGVGSWVWVLPTGTHVADQQETVLTATSAGSAEVVLRTRAPDGTQLEARHTLRVVE